MAKEEYDVRSREKKRIAWCIIASLGDSFSMRDIRERETEKVIVIRGLGKESGWARSQSGGGS